MPWNENITDAKKGRTMKQQRSGTNRLIEARLRTHAEALASGKSADEALAAAKAVTRKQVRKDNYRVVYGETMPAWEKSFPTKREAEAFAKKHESFGDVIFSIAKIVPGEPPQSLIEAIKHQSRVLDRLDGAKQ